MAIHVGQTVGVRVSKLYDAQKRPLVSPVVEISLVRPNGSEMVGEVEQQGATYYAEFTPDINGDHTVVANASAGGGNWHLERRVTITANS